MVPPSHPHSAVERGARGPQLRTDWYRLREASSFSDAVCHAPERMGFGRVWASLDPMPLPHGLSHLMLWPSLPHTFLSWGCSLCNTYTRTLSQALLLETPPRMVSSNQIVDVKDSHHILMAEPWRSTGLEVMELRRGALRSPFTAPLLQVSGCLILYKDVNHAVYKVHPPPLSSWGFRATPEIGRSRCSPRPPGQTRRGEVTCSSLSISVARTQSCNPVTKLFRLRRAAHACWLAPPERPSTERDEGFARLDVAF